MLAALRARADEMLIVSGRRHAAIDPPLHQHEVLKRMQKQTIATRCPTARPNRPGRGGRHPPRLDGRRRPAQQRTQLFQLYPSPA
ncbi:hypothetical protein ABZ783_24525 [Micromonospora sp. NPDC047738]|uniref:hypothetical protein n=1 Tax=Micromonospora sp. NPDC047738 TaxID=3155741 RepID=UPI0033E9BA08